MHKIIYTNMYNSSYFSIDFQHPFQVSSPALAIGVRKRKSQNLASKLAQLPTIISYSSENYASATVGLSCVYALALLDCTCVPTRDRRSPH